MSKKDKELLEISHVYFRAGWKELAAVMNWVSFSLNVATIEFRFGDVLLPEKLVFDKTYKKISIAGSHFGTHGYAIGLFEKLYPNEKQLSVSTISAKRSNVSDLGSLTVRWSKNVWGPEDLRHKEWQYKEMSCL